MSVVARGHAGDSGGDPPDGGHWRPPVGCEGDGSGSGGSGSGSGSKRGRGKTRNKGLKAAIGKHAKQPCQIDFEFGPTIETYIPVGEAASQFSSVLGTIVDKIPRHYPSWAKVPPKYQAIVIPELRTYFDLQPHLQGTKSKEVKQMIDFQAAKTYRSRKTTFKREWWTKRGGDENPQGLRDSPPPDMEMEDWHKYFDFVTSEKFQARSKANKECRAKQTITSGHGRKKYAQYRWERRDPVSHAPPSPIDEYRLLHSKNGLFTTPQAAAYWEQMVNIRGAQAGVANPMTDVQIVEAVLGSRRGWQRGIGQKISQAPHSQTATSFDPSQRMYTQEEVDALISKSRTDIMQTVTSQTAPLYEALHRHGLITTPTPLAPPNADDSNDADDDDEEGDEEDDEEESSED